MQQLLLGYLLLGTSAITLRDPKLGDGAFSTGQHSADEEGTERREPAQATNPVPGGLSPTRDPQTRRQIADAQHGEVIDPAGQVDRARFPTVHRLAAGLAQDRWDGEFDAALQSMLDRIEKFVHHSGAPGGPRS